MTAKQKEIQNMMPLVEGGVVLVWISQGRNFATKNKEAFCEGTAESFTGTNLVLKWATLWNGKWSETRLISAGMISKIELKK